MDCTKKQTKLLYHEILPSCERNVKLFSFIFIEPLYHKQIHFLNFMNLTIKKIKENNNSDRIDMPVVGKLPQWGP